MRFSCVASAAHFFILRGDFVAEINTIKELYDLSEMNKIMYGVIDECAETCSDPKTKEKLAIAKSQIDTFSAKKNSVYQKLTPDEAVIVLLLSFIREKEMNCDNNTFDIDILNNASKWLADFRRKIF